jgi:hypothetical protein
MHHRDDGARLHVDLINEPIGPNEQFANIIAIEFRRFPAEVRLVSEQIGLVE